MDIVDIKEQRKITPSDSNNPVVLPLGKLMPSVNYFWKLIYMYIWTQEKVGIGTSALCLFPVQSIDFYKTEMEHKLKSVKSDLY